MADQDLQEHRLELGDLYRKARSREITIGAFFEELESLRITGFAQALHIARAFGINLGDAKMLFIERQPGGVEVWERQWEQTLEEIDQLIADDAE